MAQSYTFTVTDAWDFSNMCKVALQSFNGPKEEEITVMLKKTGEHEHIFNFFYARIKESFTSRIHGNEGA